MEEAQPVEYVGDRAGVERDEAAFELAQIDGCHSIRRLRALRGGCSTDSAARRLIAQQGGGVALSRTVDARDRSATHDDATGSGTWLREADARTRTGDPFITSEEIVPSNQGVFPQPRGFGWTEMAVEGHFRPCGAATVLQRIWAFSATPPRPRSP